MIPCHKGGGRGDEVVWMDREDEPPDDTRYNGEGKKNCCNTREHAEDSFEASNCNTRKFISKTHNKNAHSTTQAKPIS